MTAAEPGAGVVVAEEAGGVGCITLNRPERRNALHRDMHTAIVGALDGWSEDDAVRCVVVTGAGKGFCAGGDVRAGRARNPDGSHPSIDEATEALLEQARTAQRLHEYSKPTIAAVNGAAVGAGMALALACDLRVLARSARLIPGWAPLAFTGDFGGPWFLTRFVGPARAFEILATNRAIDAAEAASLGLANAVLDDDGFREGWLRYARPFVEGPREALCGMKANVREAQELPLRDYLPVETSRQVRSGRTAEHRAAVRAWIDGGVPDDEGRGRASATGPAGDLAVSPAAASSR